MEEHVHFLVGERIYMRHIERDDLDRSRRWINDPEVRRYLGRTFPVDSISQESWHENRDRGAYPTDLVFAIILKDGDRHIGNMGLHGINWVNRFATTGTLIGEKDCWGKGYAPEAKMLLLDYAFNSLGMRRIESVVLSPNKQSLRALEKCGYVREGVKKEKFLREGRWVDEIFLGLTAEAWQNLQRN